MAAEGGRIDFMFLGPPPPYPADGSATGFILDQYVIVKGRFNFGLDPEAVFHNRSKGHTQPLVVACIHLNHDFFFQMAMAYVMISVNQRTSELKRK